MIATSTLKLLWYTVLAGRLNMTTNRVTIKWEYEDQLPKEITDEDYNAMYSESKIVFAVRMFPYVEINEERYYLSI